MLGLHGWWKCVCGQAVNQIRGLAWAKRSVFMHCHRNTSADTKGRGCCGRQKTRMKENWESVCVDKCESVSLAAWARLKIAFEELTGFLLFAFIRLH